MKASILSTIAACVLPLATIAAPHEGARGLVKRDCPSIFSMRLTIEDNSTYWLAPVRDIDSTNFVKSYRTRYTASGRRARIFPYDSRDEYVLTNDTTLEVVHTDLPPDWGVEPPRFGYAFPLSTGNLAMYFVMERYFEEHPEHAAYNQDFVVTTIDAATCEVTLSFGGQQQYLHFPAAGNGAPQITLRTDNVPRADAHAVQTITAVPVNW